MVGTSTGTVWMPTEGGLTKLVRQLFVILTIHTIPSLTLGMQIEVDWVISLLLSCIVILLSLLLVHLTFVAGNYF